MDSHLIENVRVIRLKGTREERARIHGELIASLSEKERKSLVYTPLSQKNQTLIKRATARFPGVGSLIGNLYEALVLERFLRLPKKYRARLEPFAKASKLPLKTIWLSLYQPDMLMVLAAASGEKLRNRFLEGMPGCSTASVQSGDAVYFLRNLDYPAAGFWEKHPSVFYHEPTDEGSQNYISVASLGIHTAGLTGFNQSGIAFSLHAHFSKKVSLKGVPIFFLGEEIMEKAKTLDEAVELCRKFHTIGSWAMNLTSFHEKKSICVEISNRAVAVRESEDLPFLAHANAFQANDFKVNSIHFTGAMFEDSESRKTSLEKTSEVLAKSFSWPMALAALANHEEPNTGELRVFGNTVSLVTTIQSIAFDPKEECLYVSTRNETPVTLGPYLKLPFQFSKFDPHSKPALVNLPKPYSEAFVKALHLYHQAYVSYQVNGEESDVALSYLIQASECLPEDPHLLLQRGYFELMNSQPKEAHRCFDQALQHALSKNLVQVAHYFRGVTLDLLGDREAALVDYQAILAFPQVDSKLARKTKRRLNQPYLASYCQRIAPDLQFAEPLEYV